MARPAASRTAALVLLDVATFCIRSKRAERLIQPSFLALVTPLLRPGALVHCATDWEPYAEQMLEVLTAAPGLVNEYPGFAPRPGFRPMTKFERQGLAKGHVVRDLLFRRT